MAAATTQAMGSLPSGLGICTTAPDIFYLPELVSRPHQRADLGGVISGNTPLVQEDTVHSVGICACQNISCVEKSLRGENVHVEEAQGDHGTYSQSGSGTFASHVSLFL